MLQTFTRPFIQDTGHVGCALPSVTGSHGKILSTPEGRESGDRCQVESLSGRLETPSSRMAFPLDIY